MACTHYWCLSLRKAVSILSLIWPTCSLHEGVSSPSSTWSGVTTACPKQLINIMMINYLQTTFKFLTIPDGLPPDHGLLANLAEHLIAVENLGPVLEHHLRCRLAEGTPPITLEESKREDKLITYLPGNLPPLLPNNLISFYRAADTSDVLFQWSLRESQVQSKVGYVLVNTFDELEAPETVTALTCNGCPPMAVGPVFIPNFLEGRDLN
ncbi:hypothetical protein SUGI_0089550 [Cryptomeria japonica]|nr:hypothetical protein SUGI_0089550 [Cryptomeria japonica]